MLIIAEDIEETAMQTLLMNHQNGSLKCCPVTAPSFADRRLPALEDIATLTGGTVFSKELNRDLDTVTLDQLGSCERIEVDSLTTTFIGGRGDPEVIEERVAAIRKQLETASNDYNADKLRNRLAKLTGGVAVIKVGGATATPAIHITMPTAHLEVPTHSIEDVISVETAFNALPSTIDGTNEVTLKYFPKV